MTVYRLIAPNWLSDKGEKRVLEGEFSWEYVQEMNQKGYNVYTLPNHPTTYTIGTALCGGIIDIFDFVFVDMDLKEGKYVSKDAFLDRLQELDLPPSKVIDSGNGIHAYWRISDLDAMSYLRLSRRLQRLLNTDDAVGQIFQLLRVPDTLNTKIEGQFIPCFTIYETDLVYSCEDLDKMLPPISPEDEKAAVNHFNKTYNIDQQNLKISDKLPGKFGTLLRSSKEVKDLWIGGNNSDRSAADFRLACLMYSHKFTKDEAASVLVNTAKAITRSDAHRVSYATNIIDKVWPESSESISKAAPLSQSIRDILSRPVDSLKGTRFRCHPRIDNTEHGFRLGQVLGLVAGSGVGKTAFALNMFLWFSENNPDLHHFFVPLEQPVNEIADRWNTMTKGNDHLNDKVHLISNYDDDGNFRHLSLKEIQEYIENWQKTTQKKAGCVVIDHIGALEKSKDEENQSLMDICHQMKAFAVQTDTFLVMQSQTSREKAGIGDLELNKDAAYGTSTFEWYCDFLVTLWQPLKRCHAHENCPTATAYKFCKIRFKKAKKDKIQEDVPYYLYFDSSTELFREMTQDDIRSFDFWLPQATKKRNADRKTDIVQYQSLPIEEAVNVKSTRTDNDNHDRRH